MSKIDRYDYGYTDDGFGGARYLGLIAKPEGKLVRFSDYDRDMRALLEWAVDQWHDEVASRPMINAHRRSLDDTWRQVIRRLGGDDIDLCGPRHDDLLAQQEVQS